MSQTPSAAEVLQARLRRSKILNIVLTVISLFLVVVVIAQLTTGSGTATAADPTSDTATEETADSATTEAADLEFTRDDPDDPMAMGDIDAPITIVEWADYRCPYCALFTRETFPTIKEEYIDTGLVRYEFHDVAYFGDQSLDAAIAGRAAAAQGKFWEYLTLVFENAPESGHADLPRETLIEYAEEVGVPDIEAFTAALDDPELEEAVNASQTQAQSLGISSVPFFAVDQYGLSGAQSIDTFRTAIDQALVEVES